MENFTDPRNNRVKFQNYEFLRQFRSLDYWLDVAGCVQFHH